MGWKDVGTWLKENATGLVGLAGSIATGNIAGGVAAVASMVSQATGTDDPVKALNKLKTDPATLLELEKIAKANEADIRMHHREMLRLQLEDDQAYHSEQQKTIRSGDAASDEYVRHTRPGMARKSFWAGSGYIIVMELLKAFDLGEGANFNLAGMLFSVALAYMGFRTWDKIKGAPS